MFSQAGYVTQRPLWRSNNGDINISCAQHRILDETTQPAKYTARQNKQRTDNPILEQLT